MCNNWVRPSDTLIFTPKFYSIDSQSHSKKKKNTIVKRRIESATKKAKKLEYWALIFGSTDFFPPFQCLLDGIMFGTFSSPCETKEKHIRCIVMMLFFLTLVLVFFLHPSEKKSIKVFRMRGKCIHTEKMFLLRSIFDVSGPSASEFLIFFSLWLFYLHPVLFWSICTHIQRARERTDRKNVSRHERIGWRWRSRMKFRELPKLTDYHSPPWFHSNPSHLGNPILMFHYNTHNIDTISYDACSSDHFDHFLSLFPIKILFFSSPFFSWFFFFLLQCHITLLWE